MWMRWKYPIVCDVYICIPYTNEISMDSGNQTSIWQSRRRVRLLKLVQCAVREWHGAHPRLLNTWSLTSTTPPCILWILWILSASSRPVRPVRPVCPVCCPSKAMLVPSSITSSEFSKCGKSKSWVTIQRSTTKRHPATTIRPTLERCVTEFPCWYVARALWLRKMDGTPNSITTLKLPHRRCVRCRSQKPEIFKPLPKRYTLSSCKIKSNTEKTARVSAMKAPHCVRCAKVSFRMCKSLEM